MGSLKEGLADGIVSSAADVWFILTCFWHLLSLFRHANTLSARSHSSFQQLFALMLR